jgi:hypothetical protein
MNYEINLIFTDDDDYSNKAKWCNDNGCYIEEIEPLEDGTRQFQIKQCEKIEEPQIKMDSTYAIESAKKQVKDLQTEISQLTARIEQLEKGKSRRLASD